MSALAASTVTGGRGVEGPAPGGAARGGLEAAEVPAGFVVLAGDDVQRPEVRGEFLRHQDSVAILRRDHRIKLIQIDDGWNEIIRYALNSVRTRFEPRRQGRRLSWLEGVNSDVRVRRTEGPTDPHDRTTRADASDEGVRPLPNQSKLA